jgi:hypothetical protein
MKEHGNAGTLPGLAYGFRVAGIDSRYLQRDGDPRRPLLTVTRTVARPGDAARPSLPGTIAVGLVGGGRLVVDRDARSARFETPEPLDPDDVVHPYLAPAAAVLAGWEGWNAFHAGAFAHGGRTIAVLGRRERGKSTLLAALALDGVPVVTDDMLVLERRAAHAGPRCIDLRATDLDRRFLDARLVPSRSGDRLRLGLPSLPSAPELAGWVALEWGRELELEPLRPGLRLHRLASAHSRAGSPNDDALLELAQLPGWELRRPPGLDLLPETVRRLLEVAVG